MTDKAYLPVCVDGDSDVDCIIEYEVTGFYSLHLTACKVYDDGPDILPMIDEAERTGLVEPEELAFARGHVPGLRCLPPRRAARAFPLQGQRVRRYCLAL